ncbi:hypothetical protein S40285_09318 [Stachybotrys chlorohalonatus IBT 40285]|uniref:Uncharacterized protein n=1 Tax=Stachybotrys chlorohalonatus (strain IBT 40285) TaxID=1283841 RepID=A0A084R2Y7_STAC4|nr:hypothetical protein S40285_09318 [Stachybotrys chlorohalonata IBT 40285]
MGRLPWIIKLPFMITTSELEEEPSDAPWKRILKFFRTTNHGKAPSSRVMYRSNIESIGEQFEQWRFANCQLCFSAIVKVASDHTLERCSYAKSSRSGQAVQEVLYWLDTLRIPRFIEDRPDTLGCCSLCVNTATICHEIATTLRTVDGVLAEEARKSIFDATLGRDGLCENKPEVKRTIAALWVWQNGILGKALTALLAKDERVDITAANQVRCWFERFIKVGDIKAPRLLLVFDLLVAGFYFWRQARPNVIPTPNRTQATASASTPLWISQELDQPERIKGTLD